MDPLTIAAIVSGVGAIFGGVAKKKQANAAQNLEEQQYNDQIRTYYAEHAEAEKKRMQKARLITAFAKANGLDSALTPEMMSEIMKERGAVAPPPYRKGGTPGFGWDLASTVAAAAGNIYGASKAGGMKKKVGPSMMSPVQLGAGSRFGASSQAFNRSTFTTPFDFS
jgi:hypothetical protein